METLSFGLVPLISVNADLDGITEIKTVNIILIIRYVSFIWVLSKDTAVDCFELEFGKVWDKSVRKPKLKLVPGL